MEWMDGGYSAQKRCCQCHEFVFDQEETICSTCMQNDEHQTNCWKCEKKQKREEFEYFNGTFSRLVQSCESNIKLEKKENGIILNATEPIHLTITDDTLEIHSDVLNGQKLWRLDLNEIQFIKHRASGYLSIGANCCATDVKLQIESSGNVFLSSNIFRTMKLILNGTGSLRAGSLQATYTQINMSNISGSCVIGKLTTHVLKLSIQGDSDCAIANVNCKIADIVLTASGNLTCHGTIDELNLWVDGSGCANMHCNVRSATLRPSGSGGVSANIIENVHATCSGSGDISMQIKPNCNVKINAKGSGNISVKQK